MSNRQKLQDDIETLKKMRIRVLKRINAVKKRLEIAEGLPEDIPWINLRVTYDIKKLRSKYFTFKEALQAELKELKQLLREIRVEEKYMHREYSVKEAERRKRDIRKTVQNEFKKNASTTGTISDKALNKILKESDKVLKTYITILEDEPSEQNMKNVVNEVEVQYSLGIDDKSSQVNAAMNSLKKASIKIWEKADSRFRRNPTKTNLFKLLQALKTNSQFNEDLSSLRPDGWVSVNTTYRSKKRETLSQISKKFYNSIKYWDIIYIENYNKIGDNPDKLKANTELIIP